MVHLLPKKSTSKKRRLAKSWSSLLAFLYIQPSDKPRKHWRSKRYQLKIWPHRSFVITRRTFRTQKQRRSKKYKQLVFVVNNYPFPVRELVFSWEKLPSRARSKTKAHKLNERRTRLQWALPVAFIVIGLTGTMFFSLQAVKGTSIEPENTFSVPTPATQTPVQPEQPVGPKVMSESQPTHIRITRLGIDYPMMDVGNMPDGSMETPPLFQNVVGWYKHGPTPGELGPSVVVGHLDTHKGPSVFWKLRQLVAGDVVEITRADGSIAKFQVESLQQFSQSAFPTEQVYGNIDHAGLRLITCGGAFNRKTGHFTENTVVFARLIV